MKKLVKWKKTTCEFTPGKKSAYYYSPSFPGLIRTAWSPWQEEMPWEALSPKDKQDNDWAAPACPCEDECKCTCEESHSEDDRYSDHSFVKVRGNVVPLEHFMMWEGEPEFGLASDSWFAGSICQIHQDGRIRTARYMSHEVE
jgi:hypothetical protein